MIDHLEGHRKNTLDHGNKKARSFFFSSGLLKNKKYLILSATFF